MKLIQLTVILVSLLIILAACATQPASDPIVTKPAQTGSTNPPKASPSQDSSLPSSTPLQSTTAQTAPSSTPTETPASPATETKIPSSEPTSSVQMHQVRISGFKFVPAELMVSVGDTVVWTNEDSVGHSVVSTDQFLHSDLLGEGKSHSQVMSKPGTFSYVCGPHPSMKGKIIVK